MRLGRLRKAHKTLDFYKNNFGFRPPFQVLVDGTLCHSALQGHINLQEQIPKYFSAAVKLLTTSCIILETESLGPSLYGATLIVKQFPVHKCGHENQPVSGASCILSMIGRKNKSRYIVATQDRELQEKLRQVPGVPLLYIHHHAPTLESPSPASLNSSEKSNEAKFDASQQPGESVSEIKKRILGEEKVEERKPRRKRPSGPNPLSCKKKKKKTNLNRGNEAKEAPSKERPRKRVRRRVKIPQHVKDHISATVASAS